jgi:Flp pilus assembly protein TadD
MMTRLALCAALALARPAAAEEPWQKAERGYRNAQAGLWREAIRQFDAALEGDPGNARLWMDLGYARQAAGELSAAADDFRIAVRLPGEHGPDAQAALDGVLAQMREPAHLYLMDEGYDALRLGREDDARRSFEQALKREPRAVDIYKELGYLHMRGERYEQAIRRFEAVRRLQPRDNTTALEIGYLYDRVHDREKAAESFWAASKSQEPEIRDEAVLALYNIGELDPKSYLDVFSSPFYSRRFENAIALAEAQAGFKPKESWPVSFYVAGRYTQDSRSHGGEMAEIYSDNAIQAGLGARLKAKGSNLSLSVEPGVALTLTKAEDEPRKSELMLRILLADYRYWNARWWGPLGLATFGLIRTHRAFTDLDWSVGYYTRYENNVIGTLQIREGFRIWDGASLVAAYVFGEAIKDGNHDFYHNLVQGGVGTEIRPFRQENVRLRAEALRGMYFGIEGRDPNPYDRFFTDYRFMLIATFRLFKA